MQHDPELLQLLDGDTATGWIGESGALSVRVNQAQHVQDADFAHRALSHVHHAQFQIAMLIIYVDFFPKVQCLLSLVPDPGSVRVENSAFMLPCRHRSTTPSPSSATHVTQPCPILPKWLRRPSRPQPCLVSCWCAYPDRDLHTINKALRIYEQLHKQRAETLVDFAAANGRELHLGGGVAKEEHEMQFSACGGRY